MLRLETPLFETLLRGTAIYLGAFVLLRGVRRQSGIISTTDLLVVVLLADAGQNAMADDYRSVPDGLLLVAVIVGWSFALDWLGYHVPLVQRLVHPPPLPLVEDGRILYGNLRRELVTREELLTQLREQGIDDPADVHMAFMEGDGRVSAVKMDRSETSGRRDKGAT